MYTQEPKMSTWIIAALAAAFFAVLAYYLPEGWPFAKAVFLLFAIVAAFVFIVSAFDWIQWRTSEHIRERESARVYGTVQLANALKGLDTNALGIVSSQDVTRVMGMVGETGILWMVKCPGIDVPYEFVEDYLIWSQQSDPYLWPIGQAHRVGVYNEENDKPWRNAERLAAGVCDLLVKIEQVAEPANGPLPAKLKVPLEVVAKKYGVDL